MRAVPEGTQSNPPPGPLRAGRGSSAAASRELVRLLPLLLVFLLPACAPKPPATTADAAQKVVPVTVADAKAMKLRRTVPVSGTLYPYEDVMLAPKVGGRVLRAYHDIGERVAPGELLMELDPTEFQLAVAQARPAFEAELRKLKLPALPRTDAEFEPLLPKVDAVAEAKANADFAESEFKRVEKEVSGGVGSRQALDSAINRVAVARTRVLVAETEARVTLANARRLKAVLEDAERRLADTKLCAPSPPEWNDWIQQLGKTTTPLSYAVSQRMVSPGSSVESVPLTTCFRLVIDHALKFGVAIPEKHAPEVLVNQTVELRVQAYPSEVFAGFVARISPTTDPTSRTFSAVIGVRNGDGKLKAGGFATGEVVVGSAAVVTVPPEALVSFAGVNKVFVVEGEKARAVEVTVGTRDKEWLEVTGVPAGAKVVTSGQSQLVDGAPVRIK